MVLMASSTTVNGYLSEVSPKKVGNDSSIHYLLFTSHK